jgi:TonB family protein
MPQPEQRQAMVMPQPPPPLPPAPPRPRPTPRAAPGTFANPMDLSFGPSTARPPPERMGRPSRGINLALGTPHEGPARSDPYAEIRAANASADWNRGLMAYWLRHRYYPQQAAENGEDGTVVIELTVNKYGRVEQVDVKSRSGSPWLDMAAVGTFRNGQLPPFTPEMREDRITFTIPIHYILIRG